MKQLDPESFHHFQFHQSIFRSNGIAFDIEDVSENLVWLRIKPPADLRGVVSKSELMNLAQGVFRFLPYQPFVTVDETE